MSTPPVARCSASTAAMFLSTCQPRRRSFAVRILPTLAILAALLFSLTARGEDWNARVLAQIGAMPQGGGYQANRLAYDRLTAAIDVRRDTLAIQPAQATPSFCSEATYLVFLKTVATAPLAPSVIDLLPVRGQPDGYGVWGRWNANGPGTARLFRELGLGRNFDDFSQARPGDFMKIFWSSEVGRREHGHSVIFLGRETQGGVECVRFWSSNASGGYGIKSVPRTRIAYAIFSRLEHPEALNRLSELPETCTYLARLGATRSSRAEAKSMTGI